MPSNRARIDIDLVQPTQYNIWPNKKGKKLCPKPWPLPKFERMSARNLILSDSAPKNKLVYQNTMVFGLHQKLHIHEYGVECSSIDWLDLIDNSWTRIDALRDSVEP